MCQGKILTFLAHATASYLTRSAIFLVMSKVWRMLPEPVLIDGPLRILATTANDDQKALAGRLFDQSRFRRRLRGESRPRMRILVDVLSDWNGVQRYHRVPGTTILGDAESPDQLRLFVQAVIDFAKSLDGKYLLATEPEPQAVHVEPPPSAPVPAVTVYDMLEQQRNSAEVARANTAFDRAMSGFYRPPSSGSKPPGGG